MSLNPSGTCLLGQEHYRKLLFWPQPWTPTLHRWPQPSPLAGESCLPAHTSCLFFPSIPFTLLALLPPLSSEPDVHRLDPCLIQRLCPLMSKPDWPTGHQVGFHFPGHGRTPVTMDPRRTLLFFLSLLCVGLRLSSLLRCNSWQSSKGNVTQITQGNCDSYSL